LIEDWIAWVTANRAAAPAFAIAAPVARKAGPAPAE